MLTMNNIWENKARNSWMLIMRKYTIRRRKGMRRRKKRRSTERKLEIKVLNMFILVYILDRDYK